MMPLLCSSQRNDEWQECRKGRITASLAAACLGLDPHKSAARAWREIVHGDRPAENRHMAWGRRFEPEARAAYEVLSGELVTETGFWVHPEFDWLGASPDGLCGSDGCLECKCPSIVPTEIPLPHETQMRVQMACCGRKWCDYFVWCGQSNFCKRVERKPEVDEVLLNELAEFYHTYVVTGVEPPRKRRRTA